ncbi:MAG TPA: hypothetical protein VJX67_04010 [Blastocatellia bacterium]|nr:hypothetical protein [Blastocatellia bacterium]
MEFHVGDMLTRRVKGPINGRHYGIYVGSWRPHEHAVFHNTIGGGCRIVSFSEFAAGKPVWVVTAAGPSQHEVMEILQRVDNLLGRIYRPIRMNCETAANYVQAGVAFSQSVEKAYAFLERVRFVIPLGLGAPRQRT